MQLESLNIRSLPAKMAIFICVVAGYFCLGNLGLELATINNNSSPIWPAAGMALGSVLLFGNWVIPAVYIGAFLTNWYIGTPVVGSLTVAFGNTIQAYLAAYIIQNFSRRDYLYNYSEVGSLLFASFVAAAVGTTIATAALSFSGVITNDTVFDSWYTWWSGDVTGIFIITPLFLELVRKEARPKEYTFTRFVSGSGVLFAMVLVIFAVFLKGINQAYLWILTPIFTIAGIKIGNLFTRILLIIISAYVVILTARGYGPFEHGNINRNLLYAQMLIASYSIGVLFAAPLNVKYKLRPRFMVGLSLGWVALFAVIYFSSHIEKKQTLNDFEQTVRNATASLHNLTRQYELLLEGQGTTFGISENLSEERWQRHVNAHYIESLTDILNSIGLVKPMSSAEAQRFVKMNNLTLKTLDKEFAAKQNEHYLVIHHKGFYNGSVRGWDLASEKLRKEAADEAKRRNRLVMTEPLKLRRDEKGLIGFLVFHPIFSQAHNFLGWNYISALGPAFFGRAFSQFEYLLNVRVHRKDKVIFETAKDQILTSKSPFHIKENVRFFEKDFVIEFFPTNNFFQRHSGYSAQLALLMNLFILFITGFFMQQLTFGQRAEELVEKRSRELELSKIQLIQSSKMASLGEMASGMAHEINNPLTIIQGKIKVITMLLEDLKITDETLFSEIDKMKVTTDRIGKIVKGLRNFSRLSDNDPFEAISLNKLISETLDLCSERFKSEGIDLRIEQIPPVEIICRPGEILQVLINLLNNSSDALQGMHKKWIQVSFEKISDRRLQISVSDSGKGIPQEIVDKIMDPFFTTKGVGKGTGLGLSISKGIIEAHGGQLKMDLSSEFTKFCFDLEFKEA